METKEQKTKKKVLSRKALVIPAIQKSSESRVFYEESTGSLGTSGQPTGCMGSTFGHLREYGRRNVRIFVMKTHNVTVKDANHWVIFINRCGFKCTFTEAKDDKLTYVGYITFKGTDYENGVHMHLGITAARYICMHIAGYNEIPKIATELYEQFEELDAYQALILAHYGTSVGVGFHGGHGMITFSYGSPTLISKEAMLKRVTQTLKYKGYDYKTPPINMACSIYKDETPYLPNGKELIKLVSEAQKGNWLYLIEKLYSEK